MAAPVLINGSFVTQRVTGPQRYAIEIDNRMLRREGVRMSVPVPSAHVDIADQRVLRGRHVVRQSWGWAQCVLPRDLESGEVLWSPTPRAPLHVRRHVVTIHDVAVLEHPEWYARSFHALYRFVLPLLARTASGVVTSSRFSKERIVAVLGIDPAKVSVVHGGVGDHFRPASGHEVAGVRAKYGLPERFLLALGTLQPRKNLMRLVDAWSALPDRTRTEWPLVLVGASGRQFARHGVSTGADRRQPLLIGYVPDDDLPALYTAASLLVYPSLYEGFGLPPLEAMRCGTPVLASRSGACAEVLDGSAALFDPTSTDELGAALRHLIDDETERLRLARSGLHHAASFAWSQAADAMLGILRQHEPAR